LISTRLYRRWSALILTGWICVLFGTVTLNARTATIGQTRGTPPNQHQATASPALVNQQSKPARTSQQTNAAEEEFRKRTLQIAEKQNEILAKQVGIYRWLLGVAALEVLVLIVQVIALVRTLRATEVAARAAGDGVVLANKTLVLAHPPRLVVRKMYLKAPEGHPSTHKQEDFFVRGQPIRVRFFVSNIGGTTATITDGGCWVYRNPPGGWLPALPPYEGLSGQGIALGPLVHGDAKPVDVESNWKVGEPGEDPIEFVMGRAPLYVMGWFTFADESGFSRTTAFCRIYQYPSGYFVPVENRDYEHADAHE